MQPNTSLDFHKLLKVSDYIHKPTHRNGGINNHYWKDIAIAPYTKLPHAGSSIGITCPSFQILMLVHLLPSQGLFFIGIALILDVLQQFSI